MFSALVPVGFGFESRFEEHYAHLYELIAAGVELVLILSILLIYKIGATPHEGNSAHGEKEGKCKWSGHRWHEKWLEYRLLAERFRYMEILYPLGIDPIKDGVAHAHEQDGSWIRAYYAHRLSEVRTNATDDFSKYKHRLKSIIKGQVDYHKDNAERMGRIHRRLHLLATVLFYGTLLSCAAHFVFHLNILTLLAGFFPAWAASIHGTLASGEFAKIADVSEGMEKRIEELDKRLDGIQNKDEMRSLAIDFHNIVIKDVLGWKAIFMDKNVPLA